MVRVVYALLTLLGICLLFGCCDECTTCPDAHTSAPYAGWLYFTNELDGAYNLYKVDMETDSIIDSLMHESAYFPGAMAASPDGRFLAVGFLSPAEGLGVTRVLDAQDLTTLWEASVIGSPFFDSERHMLLIAEPGRVSAFDTRTFSLLFADTLPAFLPGDIDRETTCIYGTSAADFLVCVYDYSRHNIVDTIRIVPWEEDTVRVYRQCVNDSGTRLFFLGLCSRGSLLGAYDLVGNELEFYQVMGTPFGDLQLSTDEDEVYVTDPGSSIMEWTSGTVYVFDAQSGSYLEGISLYGYRGMSLPLSATEIVFSPTGEKVYIGSGVYPTSIKGSGGLLIVDTSERRISRILPSGLGAIVGHIAISPKL